MLSILQRWFLIRLLPYPILSVCGGFLYWIVEKGILGETLFYPATGNAYNSTTSIVTVLMVTFLLGLGLGIVEETLFKGTFKKLPFLPKIILKTLIYLSMLTGLMIPASLMINSINMGRSFLDPEVVQSVWHFLTSFTYFSVVVFAGFIIDLTLFFNEIIGFLGLDVVSTYFTGKYSKPVKEERIFMFLDMRGSTTIAEQLGHEKYYQLLSDYYDDMSIPIIQTRGQVYQYVGDEIIVSWKTKRGLERANCLACFYQIEDRIAARSEKYQRLYGVVPTFKAAVHIGEITRGQVGYTKREMLFIGDVLNTTARMQGLCNELGADLLISRELQELIPGDYPYGFRPKGSFELRGRARKGELFEVVR